MSIFFAQNMFELTLSQALGVNSKKDSDPLGSSKLNKVSQLTGFSDPVYAEAYVNVNQYDIVLDVLIVNQTADTLQNLTLELATLGEIHFLQTYSGVGNCTFISFTTWVQLLFSMKLYLFLNLMLYCAYT